MLVNQSEQNTSNLQEIILSRTAIKIETGLFSAVALAAIILWSSGRAGASYREDQLRFYGGEGSPRMIQCLEDMQSEINNVSLLHLAEPERLVFEDQAGQVTEYSFAYNTLWRNDYPIMANIKDFHFEYRDDSGEYSFSQPGNGLSRVRAVRFVMRIKNQEDEILANGRIPVHPRVHPEEMTQQKKMVLLSY